MDRTARQEDEARAWAERRGCSLRVLNGGHHWLFEQPSFIAEWWPSSAKLVLNRDYLHGHHAAHWPQVAAMLNAAMTATPGPSPPRTIPSSFPFHPARSRLSLMKPREGKPRAGRLSVAGISPLLWSGRTGLSRLVDQGPQPSP